MYSVTVRSHIMIAHSLPGEFFGPASKMHGATFVIDAEFRRAELDPHNVVIDIGAASDVLGEIAGSLSYRNLDDDPRFAGKLTTTEFLARFIHDDLARKLGARFDGTIKITLHESHVASASYEGGAPEKH
ncbi:MAG TPA: 6-carboxytetrahydropterin synthase [Thermoanaerobaculia bacterium]|nr:6-carboxytetrahydropterin synthase [Thermoanaerobaculia bacterium]